jgi:hypothetical protein
MFQCGLAISLAQGVEGWNKFFLKAWNIISLVEKKGVNTVQCVTLKTKKSSFHATMILTLLIHLNGSCDCWASLCDCIDDCCIKA